MSLQQIEAAIVQLPHEDLGHLARWFEEYLAAAWDRQIEADALAGKLDALNQKADEDIQAGRFNA